MSGLVPNDLFSLLRATLASLILYWLYLIVYRLYFAPEAKFPGPKLAAVTYLYEFYHDRLFAGRYVFKVQELHKQYGKSFPRPLLVPMLVVIDCWTALESNIESLPFVDRRQGTDNILRTCRARLPA